MSVTLKCPECGHTVQAADETPRTCPMCDGTMKKPGYKAKSGPTSSDREAARAKPKAKPKEEPLPLDDEDEKPAKKAKPKAELLSLDDDEDEKGGGGNTRDGRAAESLDLDPGFKNKALMRQVDDELSRGEVLHWAGRPSVAVAKKKAKWMTIGGVALALVGVAAAGVLLAVASKTVPWYVPVIVGTVFLLFGVVIAVLGPKSVLKQAERGWYAVTDRRAIVYMASLWGDGGQATSYEPAELRKMWVKKSFWVAGAGDLVFKTEVHDNRTRWVDKRTGRTVKTTGSRTVHHYGFLGIEDVKEVETLIHNVLLGGRGRDDDDDEDEDE